MIKRLWFRLLNKLWPEMDRSELRVLRAAANFNDALSLLHGSSLDRMPSYVIHELCDAVREYRSFHQ
jgi:hypothetical protein